MFIYVFIVIGGSYAWDLPGTKNRSHTVVVAAVVVAVVVPRTVQEHGLGGRGWYIARNKQARCNEYRALNTIHTSV